MGQRFLGIDVADREALYKRARGALFLKANADMLGFPVNISGNVLDRPIEELCRIVERYWQNPDLRDELGDFGET